MIRKSHPERDVVMIITSDNKRRGTGRENLSIRLAKMFNEVNDD